VTLRCVTRIGCRAAIQLTAHSRHQPLEAALPIGKKVDAMDLVLDAPGHRAGVQANRHQEDLVERKALRAIQRVAELRLESALLAHRVPRKAGYKKI
jgi:hypothetical protein